MSFALLILVLLIVGSPVTIIFNGPIIQGLVAAITASSVGLIAFRIRPGEAGFLSRVVRPVAFVAAVPAIWMLIQLVPMPNVGLAHPVWKSASAALGHPLAGSITIDPGATLISFVRYLSAASIVFVAAAVAVDRRRAQSVLFALMAATTLIALLVLTARTSLSTFLSAKYDAGVGTVAANAAGLGIIFAMAAALHTWEQSRPRRQVQNASHAARWVGPAACVIAIAICLIAVMVEATSQTYYAVIFGVATFTIVIIVRRFDLTGWGVAAIVSMTLFAATALVALQPGGRILDVALAFASQVPRSQMIATQRLLSETSWLGTGAGTFADVLPIYQDIDELPNGYAPTAAAAIMVEMGKPFFWAMAVAAIALVWILFRGALRRRRDSCYPAAGASCIVVVALSSFGNLALLSMPISTIAGAAIGMAVVQSKSRSI